MKKTIAEAIAGRLAAIENCQRSGNSEWMEKHKDAIREINGRHLPSGSGFDSGTRLIAEESTPNRLVFEADFHHMNEGGYYDGWTSHKVIATPSFVHGAEIKVRGRNRNDIKSYIGDMFAEILARVIEE